MKNSIQQAPVLYFPVKASPLQMEAGFYPLGKDLGGGEVDQYCFLKDEQFEQYIMNKRQAESFGHWVTWQSNHEQALNGQKEILPHSVHAQKQVEDYDPFHHLALQHLVELQQKDLGLEPPPSFHAWQRELKKKDPLRIQLREHAQLLYHELSMRVQEDICFLLHKPYSSLIMGHICTPSFWRPEHVKNASFWDIHHPVPGFPRDERVADRLAEHISKKGPFVRFVWTLTTDAKLDQHPRHPRGSWDDAKQVWYRVERQITIPLQGLGAIFLIRCYVHPLSRLSQKQRHILKQAIELMPQEIAEYKGLGGLKASERLLSLF